MADTDASVSTQKEFNDAILAIDETAQPGSYTISLTGDITENQAGQPGLYVLSTAPGVDVVIEGNGHTISGEGEHGGLAITTGHLSISDLTIEDTLAQGGAGGGNAGGGAGLGGGLFVGPDAVVDIDDVTLSGDAAKGGAGGAAEVAGGFGGHSSLLFPAIGGGGADGDPGTNSGSSDEAGGDGTNGADGGLGVAGGNGGSGGSGFPAPIDGDDINGSDGGSGGDGGDGGIGGAGGAGGSGGVGGNASFSPPPISGGDPGAGGDAGDAGDGGFGAGGGAGGNGGGAGAGSVGAAGPFDSGMPSDGGDGGKGSSGGDGGFGAGGGGGGSGGLGGGGGSGIGLDGANGGSGGDGGDGGNGDFGGGGAGGGPGGDGGGAGGTGSGTNDPGDPGDGGDGGQAGLAGFGGGLGADGSDGSAGPTADQSTNPLQSLGGAGGGGLGAGGGIFVAEGGQLTVDGALISGGTVTGGAAGGLSADAGKAFGDGVFIQGDTDITFAPAADKTIDIADQIADEKGSGGTAEGGLIMNGPGNLTLGASNTFTGGIKLELGKVTLAAPDAGGSGDITFTADQNATLAFTAADSPGNEIAGFGSDNFIAVTDETITSFAYAGVPEAGNLLINFADGHSTELNFLGEYTESDFKIVNNDEVTFACFLEGTLILTPDGERPVEMLKAGDEVITWTDGQPERRPLRWTGHRRLTPTRHPRPDKVQPVCIMRGAFGAGRPYRDLFVSPDHAVFVDGVLIPIKHLINGTTIRVAPRVGSIVYFHLELDSHDVILAEGLPAETYLDTGDRASFEGGETMALHPVFGSEARDVAMMHEAMGCAPLRITGYEVDRVRDRLAALAKLAAVA
ncbi:Hint domain-containing protein [Acidisoma cellulosilytica]|uniref:Hint domain-containing protein n=1 Tax=Acidisoma cellulosilyticum TaxID=2802395 RepID=A0A963Z784_9PROT|nr:Hint domain-containing protein [Acidisoma cellulosilyticum]MCB8883152.1 Hint domain-containing protein [Acidisoma cellulosilyticum]